MAPSDSRSVNRYGHGHSVCKFPINVTVPLAERGAQVAHNPAANLRLGSGMGTARDYLQHGIAVGIGTDGPASADNQNMFEAMRAASILSRARNLPPQDWISTHEAFQALAITPSGTTQDRHRNP